MLRNCESAAGMPSLELCVLPCPPLHMGMPHLPHIQAAPHTQDAISCMASSLQDIHSTADGTGQAYYRDMAPTT